MSNIIKNAAQVRAETKKNAEFETACARVMADIEKAKAEGRYHTLFCPRPYHLEVDVKAGYDFRPVGVVAGVYQTDEYICLENGKLYTACQNDLQLYEGEYIPLGLEWD